MVAKEGVFGCQSQDHTLIPVISYWDICEMGRFSGILAD